ncbi:hypothetical protein ATCC90586_009122 [Pythium insidiosum]|nr:hypothetical protein ATCC90586_009122 [Pythium insidiosum]
MGDLLSPLWGPQRLSSLLQREGLESGERLVTVAGAGRLSFAPGKNASTRVATDIGLQDAWGRASIEVEPPQCAVTKNGVTFYPRDIKALVSQLYFQSNRVAERRSDVAPRDTLRFGSEYRCRCRPLRNEFYWVDNGGCADIWPSMFHDVLLNTMGHFKLPLPVLVRFADEQAFVPIRAYRVREMRSLSINETIAEFGSSFRDRYNPSVESHGSVFTLEIDWVLSSMEDLDDDFLTMRTTLRYAFETWTRLFAREGAWLLSNASATLTPVSLEVPLPLLPWRTEGDTSRPHRTKAPDSGGPGIWTSPNLPIRSTWPNPEPPVVATSSELTDDDLPWYLVSAAIVALAVLLIELLICSLRLKTARTRSPNKRRGAGPRADTAAISTLSSLPGVSLWDEQLLMNRYIPAKQITVVRLLGGGAYGVSRNILLSEQRGRLVAKLCDFGVSRSQSSNHSMTTGVGTSRWLAPEVILGSERCDTSRDIYAFGVVLTELDTHVVPFHDVRGPEGALLADVAILQRVAHERLQPPVSAACPSALASLARACMAFDASERPSAQEQRGRLVAKLCDFGVSRSQSSNHSMTTGVGTSRWLAPEVILGSERCDTSRDIYAFGVVLTELDTHVVPFHDVRGPDGALLADVAILQRVAHERLQPPVSASCPSALASLARACMAFDASERPSAQEVCATLREIVLSSVASISSVDGKT